MRGICLRRLEQWEEALKDQETIMKENMKQLEEAQLESDKKQSEITGILNALYLNIQIGVYRNVG